MQTGSQVPGNESIPCPTCRGYGFTPPPGAPQASAQSNGEVPHLEAPAFGEQVLPDPDEWGEPVTLPNGVPNPNYGRMPHLKILVQPWGKTAGLSAQDAVTT